MNEIASVASNVLQGKIIGLLAIAMMVYILVWCFKVFFSENETIETSAHRILSLGGKLILLIWGGYFLGLTDQFVGLIEKAVDYTSKNLNSTLATKFNNASSQAKERGIEQILNLDDVGQILYVEQRTNELIENSDKKLSEAAADAIQERLDEVNYTSILEEEEADSDDAAKQQKTATAFVVLNAKQHVSSALQFATMTWEERISSATSYLALFVQALLRLIQLLLLTIFKVTFPIAILLSIFPTKWKVLETFFQGYVGVLLWTIVIALMELANKVLFGTLLTLGTGEPNTFFVILLSMTMIITYFIVPNITTMLFGGSAINATVASALTASLAEYSGFNKVLRSSKELVVFTGKNVAGAVSSAKNAKKS